MRWAWDRGVCEVSQSVRYCDLYHFSCVLSLAHISLAMLHSHCLFTLLHVCALQLLVWQEIPLDLPGGYEEGQHHTHVDSAHAGAIEILNVVDSP